MGSGVKSGGRERMEGGDCCGCGLATMNIQTGVEPQDILFVSMDNQVGTHMPPFLWNNLPVSYVHTLKLQLFVS